MYVCLSSWMFQRILYSSPAFFASPGSAAAAGAAGAAAATAASAGAAEPLLSAACALACFEMSFVSATSVAVARLAAEAAEAAIRDMKPQPFFTCGFSIALVASSLAFFVASLAARVVRPEMSYFSSMPLTAALVCAMPVLIPAEIPSCESRCAPLRPSAAHGPGAGGRNFNEVAVVRSGLEQT